MSKAVAKNARMALEVIPQPFVFQHAARSSHSSLPKPQFCSNNVMRVPVNVWWQATIGVDALVRSGCQELLSGSLKAVSFMIEKIDY